MRVIAAISVLMLNSTYVAHTVAAEPPVHPIFTPLDHFRNFALSACIAEGYAGQPMAADASAVAAGYLELGSLPLEAHTEAAELARRFLAREYASYSGEPLILMKCIDFYHSRELARLARRYQRAAAKSANAARPTPTEEGQRK